MSRTLTILSLLIALGACRGDETLSAYGAADKIWRLVEINSNPLSAAVTLTFPEPGTLAGAAPCNRYSGQQRVPYPWFEAAKVVTTRKNCPEISAEISYLAALQAATLSEVSGNTLILSSTAGMTLVFKADG